MAAMPGPLLRTRRNSGIGRANRTTGWRVYICLCHALTEADVRQAAADGVQRAGEFYAACGCRAQCGSCARKVICLLRSLVPPAEPAPELLAGGD